MSLALFRKTSPVTSGSLIPPQWSYIQSGFGRNITKVMNYYKVAGINAKAGHILLRLLMSINVPKKLPLDRYYANVEAEALHKAAAQGMVTTGSPGRIFKGIFYSDDAPEILIGIDNYFDAQAVHDNWEDVSAVYPLLHSKSDLGIQIPNGKAYSPENGLSIIVVNVSMLAVQYRAFVYAQLKKPPEHRQGIQRFLGSYVFPNMIPAQMELTFFNRLINRFYGLEVDNTPYIRHPFVLSDYTYFIDSNIDHILNNLTRVTGRFETLLENIPALSQDNIHGCLLTPDIMPTRQINWILTLSRLKALNFLIDASGEQAIHTNKTQLYQALKSLTLYDTYDMMRDRLTPGLFFEAQAYVESVVQAAGVKTYKG